MVLASSLRLFPCHSFYPSVNEMVSKKEEKIAFGTDGIVLMHFFPASLRKKLLLSFSGLRGAASIVFAILVIYRLKNHL